MHATWVVAKIQQLAVATSLFTVTVCIATPAVPPELVDAMGEFRRYRDLAEDTVRDLKSIRSDLSPDELRRASELYRDARSTFNGLIEKIRGQLVVGIPEPLGQTVIQEATYKGDKFLLFARSISTREDRLRGSKISLVDLEGIINASGEILNRVWDMIWERVDKSAEEERAKREKIGEMLTALEWKAFEEI